MVGWRATVGGDDIPDRNEILLNGSLFADLTQHLSAGLETNFAFATAGRTPWLLMPQVHWEITDHFMVQAGVGTERKRNFTAGTASLRVIYTF